MMKEPLLINGDFKYFLDEAERTNKNFFVTGRAGTGKSTLLDLFKRTTGKNVVVLAPTGVSALNVGGQTIHSFFKLPPRITHYDEIKVWFPLKKIAAKLDTLVIDEISMVRADLLDLIDYVLRLHRGRDQPFGGVQLILFGDPYQLPPVIATQEERAWLDVRYQSPYFFSAHALKPPYELEKIELTKVYRQHERSFLNLLESVRKNEIDYDVIDELNRRVTPVEGNGEGYVTLAGRNTTVDKINRIALDKLTTSVFKYHATVEGDFSTAVFPTDQILMLKEGAQVMFVRNDLEKRYVNGSIGKVIELAADKIKIEIYRQNENEIIEVAPEIWEILKYKFDKETQSITTEKTGSFTQYPLKLAWAVTIHKSQGKTFDKVIIDLEGGAFEHGQVYVALSRCRTLDGIVLRRPLRPGDIILDERISELF